ncbi:MAG: hypothetical protein M0T84_06325 [Betaproteobacteria bacterium]|nr:hypothetical protein [Betaproteobacteria bacterium]
MAVAPTAPVTSDIRSPADAQGVLKNATGKFCPSIWCGVEGYQISGIQLSSDGRTVTMIRDDGSKGDAIPVASLAPIAGSIMGQGAVHFTGAFAPNLVTTEVEAQRLVVALDMIRNGPGAPQAAVAAPAAPASAVPAPGPAAPVMHVSENTPASSPAAAPPPVASRPDAVGAPVLAGKRVAIRMAESCPSDPDPLGLVSNDFYSDCGQAELNKVKGWIAASLTAKGVFGSVGDDNPDLVLTVTMTQDEADEGAAGMFTDLAPATMKFTATYQLADTAGRVLKSGTVHHEAEEAYFGGNEDAEEQVFAGKIAAAAAAPANAAAPNANGAGEPGGAASSAAAK